MSITLFEEMKSLLEPIVARHAITSHPAYQALHQAKRYISEAINSPGQTEKLTAFENAIRALLEYAKIKNQPQENNLESQVFESEVDYLLLMLDAMNCGTVQAW